MCVGPENMLYICALGAGAVHAVDMYRGLDSGPLKLLPPPNMPQGCLISALGHLWVSCCGDSCIRVYETHGAEWIEVNCIEVDDADNMRQDASLANVIVVGCEAGALRFYDAETFECIRYVQLDAHPEGIAVSNGTVFVNVADAKHVAVVGASGDAATVPLPRGVMHNFPLCAVGAHDCVSVSRKPAALHRVCHGTHVACAPCVADCDDVAFDAVRNVVYAAGGCGFVEAYNAATLQRLCRAPTGVGARTALWVAPRDRLYVAAPATASVGARILVFDPIEAPACE